MLPLNFLLYTAVSGIFLLVAFLGVVDFSGASDFAYNPLLSATLPLETQTVAAADSTGVRHQNALVPHTWLPDARRSLYPGFSFMGCYQVRNLWIAALWLRTISCCLVRLAPWLAAWAVVSVLFGVLTAITKQT